MLGTGKQRGTAIHRDEVSKCPSDAAIFGIGWGGVDQGWVGTVLPKVLLRWTPSRLSPLVVATVSAAAAAAAAAADDDDDDNDDDDDVFLGLTYL